MPNYGSPEAFLAQQFAPRRRERTVLESGLIAVEIDQHREVVIERQMWNPYLPPSGAFEKKTDVIASGNGPTVWPLSGAEAFNRNSDPHLRSRFSYARESGMPYERIMALAGRS